MATLSAAFPCVLLTGRNSCGILCYDNDSCHLDKKDCQAREVLYDTAKSFEGAQSCTKCESAGMGRLCGVSRQTISLIERGDYSPSVTLALTIAKVCGVTVEEVFYLQEETENEK